MPFDRRDMLIMSAICTNPLAGSPTRYACAPCNVISPLAIERVPILSFRRTMR